MLGKNEKQPNAPRLPSGRDLYVAPMACAASSTIGMSGAGRGLEQRIHVGALAEQMDRNDRFRSRRDGGDGLRGVDVERRLVDIDEHRPRAETGDGAGGREKRVRRRDDLVARLDVERHERQQQRIGARGDGDRVADAEHPRHLAFERGDLGAHDEALAVADPFDRRENLGAKRPVLRLEIEQRDVQWHRPLIEPQRQVIFEI